MKVIKYYNEKHNTICKCGYFKTSNDLTFNLLTDRVAIVCPHSPNSFFEHSDFYNERVD